MRSLFLQSQSGIDDIANWSDTDRIVFLTLKRICDIGFSLICLIPLSMIIPILWVANQRCNPGPLFFRQQRMGRGCKPFTLVKFRTMTPIVVEERDYDDPLEVDRITSLGVWLRRTRIDELPQIFNILRGEMSVVGPRPDVWGHASIYCEVVAGYRDRHGVRPGITGLAQTRIGYVEGVSGTRHKARGSCLHSQHDPPARAYDPGADRPHRAARFRYRFGVHPEISIGRAAAKPWPHRRELGGTVPERVNLICKGRHTGK